MAFAVYPSLDGAVVFITAGATGFGAQIVRALAEQGSRRGFIALALPLVESDYDAVEDFLGACGPVLRS